MTRCLWLNGNGKLWSGRIGRGKLLHKTMIPEGQLRKIFLNWKSVKPETNSDLPENLPEGDTGDTRDKLAASIGVSGKTYESMVKTVNNGNPELVDMVRKKQIGAATAATIAALDKGEQAEILNGGNCQVAFKRINKRTDKPATNKPTKNQQTKI